MRLFLISVASVLAFVQAQDCAPGFCRSKWGFCGQGPAYCDNQVTDQATALATTQTAGDAPVHGPYTGKYCDWREEFSNSNFQYFDVDYSKENAVVANDWLNLTMTQASGTRLSSKTRFQDVIVEAKIKTAGGSGVVNSFILKSEKNPTTGDEVDFEIVGKNNWGGQTNFFVNGAAVYTNAQWFWNAGSDPNGNDSYDSSMKEVLLGLKWNNTITIWYVNGKEVRRMVNDGKSPFPVKPMFIQAGIWDGSDTSGWAGTVDWSVQKYQSSLDYIKVQVPC